MRVLARIIDFGVGLAVIASINEMYSAASFLRDDKKLYRTDVKMFCNRASEAASKHEAEIRKNMKSADFWRDYSDKVIDEAETDIAHFRVAIKTELDNAHIPNSNLFSYIECARTLLDVSVAMFDANVEKIEKECGRNFAKDFKEYRVYDVLSLWSEMCDILYKGYNADLNTENVTKMFDKLSKKLSEGDYIQPCMDEAFRNNPDFKNEIFVREE